MQTHGRLPPLTPKSMYRGILPPLVGVAPIASLCFASYDVAWKQLRQRYPDRPLMSNVIAGGLAAIPTALLVVPGERAKLLLQLSPTPLTFRQVVSQMAAQKNGFYRGMSMTLVRDIPANAIWFGSYHYFKQMLMDWTKCSNVLYIAPFAGAMAGISSWSVILPLDTIKTHIQCNSSSTELTVRQVLQNISQSSKGLRGGLYSGFVVAVLRAIPSNAVGWMGTETMLHLLMSDDSKIEVEK